jgi:hypothetical protein
MAKRVRIGDIIEIATARGLAYVQFSHKHVRYGALLRVLPGFYDERPRDFSKIVKQPESYVAFLPLQAAVGRHIFGVVGNLPVPDFAKPFPLFRAAGLIDPATRKAQAWWLWDGEREWRVGELTPEQRKLPLRGIWNDTLLVERIEAGWTPVADKT